MRLTIFSLSSTGPELLPESWSGLTWPQLGSEVWHQRPARLQLLLCERRGASAPAESFPSSGGDSQRETHNGNKSRLETTSEANEQQRRRSRLRTPAWLGSLSGSPAEFTRGAGATEHNLDTPQAVLGNGELSGVWR